jgi:hypothetical protein
MRRRLWSLLVLLLLSLATQAAADDGDDERESKDRGDSKDHGKDGDRGEDRKGDDDRDDDREDREDDRDDDEGREDHKKERKHDKDEKRKAKGAPDRRGEERDGQSGDAIPQAPAQRPIPATQPRGTMPPPPADAGVAILSTVLPGRITFTFLVSTAGPLGQADLDVSLPEAAAWTVTGPGVQACDLVGAKLACSFRGLAEGDVQLVQATTALREAPAWELVAQAAITTPGDPVPGNDAASSAVGLLLA